MRKQKPGQMKLFPITEVEREKVLTARYRQAKLVHTMEETSAGRLGFERVIVSFTDEGEPT